MILYVKGLETDSPRIRVATATTMLNADIALNYYDPRHVAWLIPFLLKTLFTLFISSFDTYRINHCSIVFCLFRFYTTSFILYFTKRNKFSHDAVRNVILPTGCSLSFRITPFCFFTVLESSQRFAIPQQRIIFRNICITKWYTIPMEPPQLP